MAQDSQITRQTEQDTALLALIGATVAPHWRLLLAALLLLLAQAALGVAPPYLLQQAIDGPIAARDAAGLWPLAALYGGVAVAVFGLQYAQTFFLQQAGQRALADLRTRLFDHMLQQGQVLHSRLPVGDLVARLTSDVDALNQLLSSSVVTMLTESVTLIAIVGVMLAVNWRLALLSLAVLPLLILVTRYFRRRIRGSSSTERTALARTSSFLNEQLHGMLIVQLFGRQAQSAQEFDGYNTNYRRALLAIRRHSALFLAVQEVLAALGLAALLYGGGQGVLAGWATLGMLVAFVQYVERAFQPILRLSEEYNAVQIGLGAAERVQRMLQTQPLVGDPAAPVVLPRVRGAVELREVWFKYPAENREPRTENQEPRTENRPPVERGGDKRSAEGGLERRRGGDLGDGQRTTDHGPRTTDEWVLRDLSLRIPAGQAVAIVGATGAGKSSLAALLARFYDPQSGQVLLDGIDIRRLALRDLRRAVAVVPQDPVCLAGSIAANIRLYRQDVGDAEIRRAAEISNAARFIEQLPDGYAHEVLPGGANLSVGQRQLLALARALALSPEGVLVLDEATSSIDTATEALIQDALQRILRSRTSVVIAHRLSTIQNADRIIVLHRGVIVEDGTHAQLLARSGYYARLHHHQMTASR